MYVFSLDKPNRKLSDQEFYNQDRIKTSLVISREVIAIINKDPRLLFSYCNNLIFQANLP